MGCSSSVDACYHPSKQWKETCVGLLSVNVLSFSLNPSHKPLVSSRNIFIKLTVSNQLHTTSYYPEAQNAQQTVIKKEYEFTINSCYQPNGRSLQCQIWNHGLFGDEQIGHGKVDLNSIISTDATKEEKCLLHKGQESEGNMKLKISFTSYPYDNLSFKMINALVINKRDEDLTKRKIYVRVEIGEEILETKASSETQKILPHWENQVLIFRVPSFIENGKITVFKKTINSDIQIGTIDIDMPNLLQNRFQRMFDQIFSIKVQEKEEVRGTLKFYTLKGSKNFVEPSSPRKERKSQMEKSEKFRVSPEIQHPVKRLSHIDEERQREQIKHKLKEPLPPLKKKSTNMGFALHKVENPEQ